MWVLWAQQADLLIAKGYNGTPLEQQAVWRENWHFSWVRSLFLWPPDKEKYCWKGGIRWLVRVLESESWAGHTA